MGTTSTGLTGHYPYSATFTNRLFTHKGLRTHRKPLSRVAGDRNTSIPRV